MKNIILGILFTISAIITINNIEVGNWEIALVALIQMASAFAFFTKAMITAK